MTRQYEVVYIFDSALEEPAINERLERFHSLIQQPGAEGPQVNHWGKRAFRWAYWNLLLPGRPLPVPVHMSMAGKRRPNRQE